MLDSQRAWSLAVTLVFGLGWHGCTSLPETSRTTAVHDIELEEKLSADNILVQPGDEVRWINYRKSAVRVEVPRLDTDNLSCQRGFTNWRGSLGDVARLEANETASLCFNKTGVIDFAVRADTSLGGGEQILPGVIRVGSPLASKGRAAHM